MIRHHTFVGGVLSSLVALMVLGCASAPSAPSAPPLPMKPVTSLDQIAGTWHGAVIGPGGTSNIRNMIIRPTGTWELELVEGNPPRHTGVTRLVDGRLRSKSDTTGNSATWILYEGGAKRILRSVNDDNRVTAEFTPATP